jgi:hypothetical protein
MVLSFWLSRQKKEFDLPVFFDTDRLVVVVAMGVLLARTVVISLVLIVVVVVVVPVLLAFLLLLLLTPTFVGVGLLLHRHVGSVGDRLRGRILVMRRRHRVDLGLCCGRRRSRGGSGRWSGRSGIVALIAGKRVRMRRGVGMREGALRTGRQTDLLPRCSRPCLRQVARCLLLQRTGRRRYELESRLGGQRDRVGSGRSDTLSDRGRKAEV